MITTILKNALGSRADDLLYAVGLERRRRVVDHVMTATTYFLAGAIVGGCVALFLAPTNGRALRDKMGERLREAGERARRAAGDVRERAVRTGKSRYEGAAGTAS